jgi:hypothetical protein
MVGNDQQVDVRGRAGFAASHRAEENDRDESITEGFSEGDRILLGQSPKCVVDFLPIDHWQISSQPAGITCAVFLKAYSIVAC